MVIMIRGHWRCSGNGQRPSPGVASSSFLMPAGEPTCSSPGWCSRPSTSFSAAGGRKKRNWSGKLRRPDPRIPTRPKRSARSNVAPAVLSQSAGVIWISRKHSMSPLASRGGAGWQVPLTISQRYDSFRPPAAVDARHPPNPRSKGDFGAASSVFARDRAKAIGTARIPGWSRQPSFDPQNQTRCHAHGRINAN